MTQSEFTVLGGIEPKDTLRLFRNTPVKANKNIANDTHNFRQYFVEIQINPLIN